VALILYLVIPYGDNTIWCIVCFVMFLYISYDLLKDDIKHKDYLSFNSIFLISFFLTSFAFPVFILSSNELFSQYVDMNFLVQFVDFKYLSRGVFLCLLAISVYAAAYKINHKKQVLHKKDAIHKRIFKKNTIDISLLLLLIATIYNAYYSLKSFDVTNLQQNAYVYDLLKAGLVVSFIVRIPNIRKEPSFTDNFICFFKYNRYPLIISFISILLFLYFGVRNLAISIIIIDLMTMVVYYSRLSIKYIVFLSIVGVLILFVIRETRHSDTSIMNSGVSSAIASTNLKISSPLLFFSDLIAASTELSLGVEIKDRNGLQHPEQIILVPLVPLPLLPTLVSENIWGKSYQEATGSSVLNDYMLQRYGKNATYGKHCVSDLYMKWGVLGIIVFFVILGWLTSKADSNKHNNIFWAAAYLALLSLSFFTPRDSLLGVIRPIFYVCVFLWLFSRKQSLKNKLI